MNNRFQSIGDVTFGNPNTQGTQTHAKSKLILSMLERKPIFNNRVVQPTNGITTSSDGGFFCTANEGTQIVTFQGDVLRWGSVANNEFNSMYIAPLGRSMDQFFTISDDRKFICVYTTESLRVLEIPWGYKGIKDHDAFSFQSNIKKFNNRSLIKQILFHPRSSNSDCLIVLFEDDSIILYDVSSETEVELNQPNGSLGIYTRVTDISSLTFSKDGLTLYMLSTSDGGDIYAYFPCLPSKIQLSKKELSHLLQKSVLQYDSLDSETSAAVKKNVIKQFKFISSLHIQNNENDSRELHIDEHFRYVKAQGPFTISPYPEQLYETNAKEIEVIDIGKGSEVLAMTFENGTIIMLFKDLEMSMCWESENYVYNSSLVLIEKIEKFKSAQNGVNVNIEMFRTFNETGKLLLINRINNKAYVVDTKSWSIFVSKCIEDSDLSKLSEIKFQSTFTELDVNNYSNMCGIWRYEGKSGILLVGPSHISAQYLELDCKSDTDLPTVVLKETDLPVKDFEVKFSQPLSEIMKLTDAYKKRCQNPFNDIISPQDRQAKLDNPSNEKQLEIITNLSKDLISNVVQGQTLGVMLHSRLVEQQYELTREIKCSNDIIEMQNGLQERYQTQSARWNEKIAKQTSLVERFASLNDKLSQATESSTLKDTAVSNQEKEWFKEIRNQIYKFNEFVYSQKSLQEELEFVKKELVSIKDRSKDVKDKSEDEWKELRKVLENDAATIKQCNDELQKASNDLDSKISA